MTEHVSAVHHGGVQRTLAVDEDALKAQLGQLGNYRAQGPRSG